MNQNIINIRHLQNLDLLKNQADLLAFSLAPEIEETDTIDEIAKNFSRSSPNSYQNNTF